MNGLYQSRSLLHFSASWLMLGDWFSPHSLLSSCFSLASRPAQWNQRITDPSFWNQTQEKFPSFFLLRDIVSKPVWPGSHDLPLQHPEIWWHMPLLWLAIFFPTCFWSFFPVIKNWPTQKVSITSQSKLAPFYILCTYQYFWLLLNIIYFHEWEIHVLIPTTCANISFIAK